MEAKERSIQEVFCANRVLRIPFFQRTYEWSEPNWERFDNDMIGLADRAAERKYFLGSLILKEDTITEEERNDFITSKFTIIDGQQRLTTLSLYIKALVNRIGENGISLNFNNLFLYNDENKTPKLQHSINDRDAYRDIMLDGISSYTIYKSDRVIQAYKYFLNKLQDKSQTDLRQILRAIYSNITFVAIELNNQDDEQQIFDTINSLGVRLTIDELMKNFLYDSVNETEYNNNWKPIFDTQEAFNFWRENDAATSQAANEKNTVIYNFFFDFVRIKMWDFASRPGFNAKQYVKRDEVLETCKAFVERYGIGKQDLANEIIEYAKLYSRYFNKKALYSPIPKYPCIERIACISMVHNTAMRPYILYILKSVEKERDRNNIFKFLETYIIRRAICKADTKTSEIWTEQLIRLRINSIDALRNYIMSKEEDNLHHMPTDNEVEIAIENNDLDSYSRLILYLMESIVSPQLNYGYNYFLAKQIIPSPNRKNREVYPQHTDPVLEELRKARIKTIGNYTLLNLGNKIGTTLTNDTDDEIKHETKVAKKADNKCFVDKKSSIEGYINNVRCMQWFTSLNQWSEDLICERNKDIARYINTRFWAINN